MKVEPDRVDGAGTAMEDLGEGSDDFLEYLASMAGQLVHLARIRGHVLIAFLIGMVESEAASTLEARARSRRRED